MKETIHVIGGGLAGAECSWQLAERGFSVILSEMRPHQSTPAHSSDRLAELVCSNSLRSDDAEHPAGILKREMERLDSLVIASARAAAVPAGSALAVDRDQFAATITTAIADHPRISLRREEITSLPKGSAVLATGPLTSPALADELQQLLGEEYLYFYDALAPIVDADSLDEAKLFWGSRWGKGDGSDYLNAPMTEEQYLTFWNALIGAEVLPLHDFEKALFFEGCLPLEEIARRGVQTLTFGPFKPVGLEPPGGGRPYAVLQLRQENLAKTQLNLVGCQSRLTWPEQKRVFRLIPGLEQAEFVRLGQVHRNTFINSPTQLDAFYRLRKAPLLRLAGQLTGVEGYLESAATGLLAALYLELESREQPFEPLPSSTALGALARHLTQSAPRHFQPANINFGLFDPLKERLPKRKRRGKIAARASRDLEVWARAANVALQPNRSDPVEVQGGP